MVEPEGMPDTDWSGQINVGYDTGAQCRQRYIPGILMLKNHATTVDNGSPKCYVVVANEKSAKLLTRLMDLR